MRDLPMDGQSVSMETRSGSIGGGIIWRQNAWDSTVRLQDREGIVFGRSPAERTGRRKLKDHRLP